jgi:hypothetical protein
MQITGRFFLFVTLYAAFMDSSAGICGWHMCQKDTEYRDKYYFDSRKLVLIQMNIFTVSGGYRKTYY